MKKKYLYLIILIGFVGLFIPENVFAIETVYGPYVDYRFFVEDEKENIVEDLKFKLHDINNKITYESTYDSNNKVYTISDMKRDFSGIEEYASWFKTLPSELLPNNFKDELINNVSAIDWNQKIEEIASKYPNIDTVPVRVGDRETEMVRIYIPMILEEVSGKSEVPIKKIIFAELRLIPTPIPTVVQYPEQYEPAIGFNLMIVNNTCFMYDYQIPGTTGETYSQVSSQIGLTRNNAYDYSEELKNRFSSYNFTSAEINSNNYLNRCDNKITSQEITKPELQVKREQIDDNNTNASQDQFYRTSEDNVDESSIANYCECLPVFIQKRKEQITINPATWNTGFVVLFLSMIFVTSSCFVLIKKKS